MSTLAIGAGFSGFASLFEQDLINPLDFLEDDSSEGAAFSQFIGEDLNGDATFAKHTSTEVILKGDGYIVVVNGSGLSTPGNEVFSFSDYFSNSTGTVSSIKLYQGSSVSGGTLVATATLGASSDTITVGNSEVEIDGSHLPRSFAAWKALTDFDYTGANISVSDVKMIESGTLVSQITVPSDPLTSALNDYQAAGSLLHEVLAGPFTPLQLSSAQLAFKNSAGIFIIHGTGLTYTGSLTGAINFEDISGTISSATLYKGGTYNTHTHTVTGGTVEAQLTLSANEIAVTMGAIEMKLDGSNLPDQVSTWMQILEHNYSGPAIGISDIKLLEGGSNAASIKLTSKHLTATFLGYKLTFDGTFSTALTAAMIDDGKLPTFKTTGLTITQISTGDTVLSLSGLSSPINLLDGHFLTDILSTVTSVTAADATAGMTLQLGASGGVIVDGLDLSTDTAVGTLTGGSGNDTLILGAAFKASDKINGGAGNDTATLDGDYSKGVKFGASTMVNVEHLKLGSGHNYKIVTNDATVASGKTLGVNASALTSSHHLTFDGSAETNGHFIIEGGRGADNLTGGSKSDTFMYKTAAQSSSTFYDTINHLNFNSDKFDVSGTISKIDKSVSHAVSTSSFDTDIAAAASASHLAAHSAMLVTVSSGSLKGDVFLVVDQNGTAGYQAHSDLVINLHAATGTLTTSDFI